MPCSIGFYDLVNQILAELTNEVLIECSMYFEGYKERAMYGERSCPLKKAFRCFGRGRTGMEHR